MKTPITKIRVSLKGKLGQELLAMVASGSHPSDAAEQIISRLIDTPETHYTVHLIRDAYVFEMLDDSDHSDTSASFYQ